MSGRRSWLWCARPAIRRLPRSDLAQRTVAPGHHMQLVTTTLTQRGVPARHATVRMADLPSFRSAFVTNSLGVASVGRVDDQVLPVDPEFSQALTQAYESVSWDQI